MVPGYKGILNALSKIYKDEGIRGLYKGFVWTLVQKNINRVIFFTV